MNNFVLSANVVLPLLIEMVIGLIFTRIGIFNRNLLTQMNTAIFKFFLPVLLFVNIYNSDFMNMINGRLIAFSFSGLIGLFIFLCLLIPLLEKDNGKRSVIIQGIFRSNYVLFAISVASAVLGDNNESGKEAIGAVSVMAAFLVPAYNVLAVTVFEIFKADRLMNAKQASSASINYIVKKCIMIIKGILKNPLIIASLLAIACKLTNLTIPYVFDKTLNDISKIATPFALIVLGGSLRLNSIKGRIRQLIIVLTGKLVLSPLVFISLAIVLGFRGVDLLIAAVAFGSPTAVSSFTMAMAENADSELAGNIVALTSILSIVSIFVIIFVLKQSGLLL